MISNKGKQHYNREVYIMKHIAKRIFALMITAAILCTSLPILAMADGVQSVAEDIVEYVNDPGYVELDDGYIRVQVSKSNGGFYIGTVLGDKLTKADDDKFLLYPDESFDTSFTSFRVTRDGKTQDYIFGRDYSGVGIECTDVNVFQSADNAISAEWTVDGLKFTQIIALMGTDTYQHGMAYISYTVQNTKGSAVENIDARVMMDTALGYQDYAIYMAGHTDGSYTTIDREKTIEGKDYNNYFFAYDSKTTPTVTAYTLNASVAGETIVPKKVTFAHWNNLASTVFDYEPSVENPFDYTDEYNLEFMTADSAVALYYSMGSAPVASDGKGIGLYYGVYSNYTAGDSTIAMNFTSSGTMYLNEDETAYKDLNGNLPGNFSSTVKIQNVGDKEIEKLAIAIYPGECVLPYNGNSLVTDATLQSPYYKTITDLNPQEARDIRFDFSIDPTYVTDYRKIKIVAYDISNRSELAEENKILTKETYVLCPSSDNAEISFTGLTPSSIFISGRRFVYLTGDNFGLLRDKSQYRIVLRPLDGGDDVVLDQDLVVINPDLNTATLVLDQELRVGTWQTIIDWNDAAVEDIASEAMRIIVRDVPEKGEPGFISSGVYGIVTVERSGTGSKSDPYHYEIVNYDSEEALKKTQTPAHEIMLVLRGNFNVLSSEEKGKFQAEALTLMEGDVININDTLDVKEGRVTVSVEFDGDKQKEITVDIDGRVTTTGANTKVWDGVCAITSLEEGKLYTLPVYSKDGVLGYTDGEEHGRILTLIWPSAAGVAQTLVGLALDFRYGEFCLMEQGDDYVHVVAFGAKLSPSFLVPNGTVASAVKDSNLERAHREMAISNYTAAQLRSMETQYEKDQREWRNNQVGTLNMYMDDILFGSGGFIGFNTAIEVGIPAFVDGMPYIQGTLALKIINDYWEVGVAGKADLMVFEMEAEFHIKSYNGIPIPNTIRFFVGGTNPGIPVDPFGVFWVRGAGAGIDNIYESFFVTDRLPPLTLMLSGEFAIFAVLSARADLSLSLHGIYAALRNISIAGISIIDTLEGGVYWYPNLDLSFGIEVDIFDAIIGEGSIIVHYDYDSRDTFFQAYARATVRIPKKIFLIGGTKIGSAELGVSTKKIWGSVEVIGIGVGIVYYWGGSVDISLLNATVDGLPENAPQTFALNAPVYTDSETGESLYMSLCNNVRLLASTTALGAIEETPIQSATDSKTHNFTLTSTDEDALLAISYPAKNALEAEDLKHRIEVTVGGNPLSLEWFDPNYEADHIANQGTNALLNYNEETGMATVSISFTKAEQFNTAIVVRSEMATALDLFGIERMVDFDTIAYDAVNGKVTVTGNDFDKLSGLTVLAENKNGAVYSLASVDKKDITGNTVIAKLQYPGNLQTGEYTLQVIGTVKDENGVEIASPMIETNFSYTNVAQPKPITAAATTHGGNYTLNLALSAADAEHDGYVYSIFEVTEDGYVGTVYQDVIKELTAEEKKVDLNRTLLIGGRYENTDEETGEAVYSGLEAGKKYVVTVQTFKNMPDGSRLLSTAVTTEAIEMIEPVKTNPVIYIDGAVMTTVGTAKIEIPTINTSTVTLKVSGVDTIRSGYYILGNGERVAWNGGDIVLKDLEDGMYTITLNGVNETYDSFGTIYQFSVDTTAPGMLISSPQGGGFFKDETVTVTGITEAGAKIVAQAEGQDTVTAYADGTGSFTIDVPVNNSVAYQDIKVHVYDSVGNESMPFGCTLTNELLGDPDLKAVILLDGEEVSTLVSSAQSKKLAMAFKSGDQIITLNENSAAAGRVLWRTSVIEKTASITEDGVLTGADGAVGIVTATLDNRTAVAELTAIDLAEVTISLDIPQGGYVYDGTPKTPAVVFNTHETLRQDTDYTVSYMGNVHAGTAAAVITAIENGKCAGIQVVEFTIAARSIADATLTVADDGSENPAITVTLDGKTLTQDVDYTVTYVLNTWGTKGIVAVVGMRNYEGVLSVEYEIDDFDHLTWIIPVAFVVLLGGAALVLFLIKKRRLKARAGAPIPEQIPSEEAEPQAEDAKTDPEEIAEEISVEEISPEAEETQTELEDNKDETQEQQ